MARGPIEARTESKRPLDLAVHMLKRDNLTLQTENINVNSTAGSSVAVNALQNALTVNAPVVPQA